ncbi:hypothetical protein [Asticcacaulis sp.]|uniref:WD40 repeat domain-containing protein n=1 Tax=Asticcacaulis sp. TaxID=1872648 RepID=UPI002616F7C8|nr:hypothetical protein [Asticcacaulis sp.]
MNRAWQDCHVFIENTWQRERRVHSLLPKSLPADWLKYSASVLSPNKQLIARLRPLQIVNLCTGLTCLSSFQEKNLLVWSPDSKAVASVNDRVTVNFTSHIATVSSIETPKEIQLVGHTDNITSLAWSPNGKHIVSGSWDETLRLWTPDGNNICIIEGIAKPVWVIDWSPDGKQFASGTGGKDGVRVWKLSSGEDERTCTVVPGPVHNKDDNTINYVDSLKWSPDGTKIAFSVAGDTNITVWSPTTTENDKVLAWDGFWWQKDPSNNSMSWSTDGRTIFRGMYQGMCGWDVDTGACTFALRCPDKRVTNVEFLNDYQVESNGDIITFCKWSDRTNVYFSPAFRSLVFTLMCIKHRLDLCDSQIPCLAMSLWLDIFSILGTSTWSEAFHAKK